MWKLAEQCAKYAFIFLAALLLALVLTPLFRSLARRLGMVDYPGGRRIHEKPTPRGGGLAIVLSFHLCYGLIRLFGWEDYLVHLDWNWWLSLLQASLIIILIGFMDDKFGLSAWLKLAGQVAAASLMYGYGYTFDRLLGVEMPLVISYLLTVGWFVVLTNAFNLIDGLDGLAAGLAGIAAFGLAGTALLRRFSGDALPFLALAGACVGFLRYNFHPATVFLGDCGSYFLGFSLAAMSLVTSTKTTLLTALAVPLLGMGVPLYDTLLAIWRRSVRYLGAESESGTRPSFSLMRPDRDHLHHRTLQAGLTPRRAALLLYALNIGLVAAALLMIALKSRAIGLFLLIVVAWAYLMFRHLSALEVWETGRLIIRGFSRPRRRVLTMAIYGLWDGAALVFSWTAVFMLIQMEGVVLWLQTLVLMGSPVILFLHLGRIYTRIWSRAILREYVFLGLLLLAAALCGASLLTLINGWEFLFSLEAALLFFPILAFLILGARAGFRILEEVTAELGTFHLAKRQQTIRLLAFGAGDGFLLFLRHFGRKHARGHETRVLVGVADDDPNLSGCSVAGTPVLGRSSDLAQLFRLYNVQQVVVTDSLTPEQAEAIETACREAGVTLREWRYSEREIPLFGETPPADVTPRR